MEGEPWNPKGKTLTLKHSGSSMRCCSALANRAGPQHVAEGAGIWVRILNTEVGDDCSRELSPARTRQGPSHGLGLLLSPS